MKNQAALLLFLVMPAACAAQPSTGSMCQARETTYFSCDTARHKTISLCGAVPDNLQYRYGNASRVELQFPDDASKGADQLRYAHYSRYQTDRAEVTFSRADTDYAVFDYTENDRRSAGVRAATADGKDVEIRCAGPIRGKLVTLRKSLRCDSDNALNGGQCP
ncbi:hypothetical protein [Rhodanobacter koreensis]